ncbi:hypothetical protein XELAEV_18027592mg [Xenopus laevis]|uniref:Uncharacterized protein n=1 Tax=Xenopus laevis TaxID=8355 RepID=A0A974HK79_XENLA|nr:hypothetical protein XELAEV_18027592mg [Xenopus laevis]
MVLTVCTGDIRLVPHNTYISTASLLLFSCRHCGFQCKMNPSESNDSGCRQRSKREAVRLQVLDLRRNADKAPCCVAIA